MDYTKELEDLILTVVRKGASDLHIATGRHPVIRVDDVLVPLVKKPILTAEDTMHFAHLFLGKQRAEMVVKERIDMDFSYTFSDDARFRGNIYRQSNALAVALRIIPRKIRTLEELNLPIILEDFIARKQGFFLVVGPVGSGKSTTLAAMIDIINRTRTEHIITIEDPIEYIFEPSKSIIDQREVRLDTPSFKSALRSMFRQDVDVVMVGEMRDAETMQTAVTASETGHLVLSTLHTNNATQTIDRVIDTFPAEQQSQIRAMLAGSLTGILSQRLIPRVSGGRIPAYELLINNKAIANLIRENRTHEIDVVIETSTELGMIDMNKSLAELVRDGQITPEDARAFSFNPVGLDKLGISLSI